MMDYSAGRSSANVDGSRLSSSLPQRWSHISSSPLPAVGETATSTRQSDSRPVPPPVHDADLAYRATALRQLKGNNKSSLRNKHRHQMDATPRTRSSSRATQPVLVRCYSGDGEEDAEGSKQPRRRLFFRSNDAGTKPQPGPQLPSDEDFSIEGILRAIEPNIRETLDSIAEICGRSKLSLANEYGSHIAPLGEIRAPPGGLLPVEEASPSLERQGEESILAIFEDDNSLADGHDRYTYPFYNSYLDNMRQVTSAAQSIGFQPVVPLAGTIDGSSTTQAQARCETPRSVTTSPATFVHEVEVHSSPVTRVFPSKSKSGGRALLALKVDNKSAAQNLVTPAIVSEVCLDAQADGSHLGPPEAAPLQLTDPARTDIAHVENGRMRETPHHHVQPRTSTMPDLRGLMGWFKGGTWNAASGPNLTHRSAESRLRAMLEHDETSISSTTV